MIETLQRILPYASILYEDVDFKNPDWFINQPAPPPIVAVLIGVAFSILAVFSFQERLRMGLRNLKENYQVEDHVWGTIFTRMFTACLLDQNNINFTSSYYFAVGFFFLAAYQLNFSLAYSFLIVVFGGVAIGDLLRIWLTYREYTSLRDYVVTAKAARNELHYDEDKGDFHQAKVTVVPGNIYQNVSRTMLMVLFVFFSQGALIAFLIWDTYTNLAINPCFLNQGKAPNCPNVGTMMSWLLYMLGIIMQCVLTLAAKGTHYEHTEQTDPNYWVCMFLATKHSKSVFSWEGAKGLAALKVDDVECRAGRNSMIVRLVLTTLINSWGYRMLYNSLPILLAARNSVALVIFAPISILYISHLDEAHEHAHFHVTEGQISDKYTTGKKVISGNLNDLAISMILKNVYRDEE